MIANRWTTALLITFLAVMLSGCHALSNSKENDEATRPEQKASPGSSIRSEIGFASREKLTEHYQKHGREFGSITMEEYLRKAQTLRDRSLSDDVLESVRADSVVTRFERSTGSFIAFNSNGVIRTFFKPNAGETYFRRQSQRGE